MQKTIEVHVYRKRGDKWNFIKTLTFTNFKYFVEKFITKLLKNKYERNNRLFYKPQKDGSGLLMGNWDGLYNKKDNLLYLFQINTRDMEWVMDYIEAWKLSNKYTHKDKKTR